VREHGADEIGQIVPFVVCGRDDEHFHERGSWELVAV
jgi:hypothetical protein